MPSVGGEATSSKLPWHKPVVYDLTDYIDTGGAPTNKWDPDPAQREDESRPPSEDKYKNYRPVTAAGP